MSKSLVQHENVAIMMQ